MENETKGKTAKSRLVILKKVENAVEARAEKVEGEKLKNALMFENKTLIE